MFKTLLIPSLMDPEIKFVRPPIVVKAALPAAGINPATGLLFLLEENAPSPDRGYQLNADKQTLADEHNCVVADMCYFGRRLPLNVSMGKSFKFNAKQIYGIDIDSPLEPVSFENLDQRFSFDGKLNMLDPRCMITIKAIPHEYQSWGFISAVDGLTVVGYLLNHFNLDSRRVFLQGKRYGGYVALLMGKFAPDTFAGIIDIAGYCRTEIQHIAGHAALDADAVFVFVNENERHYAVRGYYDNPWTTDDDASTYYFGDSQRRIRSLLWEPHHAKSLTRYIILHSPEDLVVDFAEKTKLTELLRKFHPTDLAEVSTSAHTASHREIFNSATTKMAQLEPLPADHVNDFTKGQRRSYQAADKTYEFSYESDGQLALSLRSRIAETGE